MPPSGGPLGFASGGGASVGVPSSTGSDHRLGGTIGAGNAGLEPLNIVGAGGGVAGGAVSVALPLPAAGSMVGGNASRAGAWGPGGWSACGTFCWTVRGR